MLPPSILWPYLSHLSVQVWSIYSIHFLISFNHSKNPFQSSYLITNWIQSSTPLFSHPFIIHPFIHSFPPFTNASVAGTYPHQSFHGHEKLPSTSQRFLKSANVGVFSLLLPPHLYRKGHTYMKGTVCGWMDVLDVCMDVCMYVLLYCTICVCDGPTVPDQSLFSGGHHPGGNQSITHTIPYYTIRGVRLGSLVGWYWLVLDLVGSGWVWSDSSSMWCDVMWCAFLSYYHKKYLGIKTMGPSPSSHYTLTLQISSVLPSSRQRNLTTKVAETSERLAFQQDFFNNKNRA